MRNLLVRNALKTRDMSDSRDGVYWTLMLTAGPVIQAAVI
jgi:hypothetical protein